MCYVCKPPNDIEGRAKELTAEQWIQLAREARDAGGLILTLTGGEVFLRPDFREIFEEVSRMGLLVQIYTNGTMITPEVIRWLGRTPPFKVSITLYGASRDTYQKVTGFADGYDRAVRAVDGLTAAGIAVQMKTTIIRDNVCDFDRLLRLFDERKIKLGLIDYIAPRREGSCSDPQDCRLTPRELVEFRKHVVNIWRQKENRLKSEPDGDDDCQSPGAPKENAAGDSAHAFRCSAGRSSFFITWDGVMTPCNVMDQPSVSVLDRNLPEVWEELKRKCSLVPVCDECGQCIYRNSCASCPAKLFRETGCFDKAAPYLCETTRLELEELQADSERVV